jgi:hypothetical protein
MMTTTTAAAAMSDATRRCLCLLPSHTSTKGEGRWRTTTKGERRGWRANAARRPPQQNKGTHTHTHIYTYTRPAHNKSPPPQCPKPITMTRCMQQPKSVMPRLIPNLLCRPKALLKSPQRPVVPARLE